MKRQLIRLLKPVVQRFPKLATTYRAARDNWESLGVPAATPMGFKLAGNQAMQQGRFEPEETQIVKELLPKVDVLLNVGANIGYYCCIAQQLNKYVVAFEPIPHNLKCLLKNITANNWGDAIEVFPVALSNKVGIAEIYGGTTGASLVEGWAGNLQESAILVPTSTMDIILGSRFQGKRCLVVADIEGAEKLMLEGACSLLCANPRPI